jgi:hypothetical protein
MQNLLYSNWRNTLNNCFYMEITRADDPRHFLHSVGCLPFKMSLNLLQGFALGLR